MSGLKAIRRRITSVKNTKQITRAMKLVSAAKLRRAQDAAINGRAYVEELGEVMETVLGDLPAGFSHPLLEERGEMKSRCIVAIAGERGLCGAYNTNVIKAVLAETTRAGNDLGRCEIVALGRRTVSAVRRFGGKLALAYEALPEDASRWPIREVSTFALHGFSEGRFDEVVLIYTKFFSAMSQKVMREVILPIKRESMSGGAKPQTVRKQRGMVKYEPSPVVILGELLPLFLQSGLLQASFEAKASEHAARMTAMDSATNNADELISKLQLYYNRARQSAITKELLDIIGGAEAIG